jgi:T5SS/PEP-CTERM-associated repeat protein
VNNTTNTIGTGVVTNGGANFHFPNSTGGNTNNLLQIIAGGVLTNGTLNTSVGSVGEGAGDLNNTILVTDSGSAWTNAGLFHIGNSGVGSALIISNYGAVVGLGSSSFIGGNAGSSNNYVIVTDHGTWNCALNPINAALTIGSSGSSNRLTVTSAGSVLANIVTLGSAATAFNNLLTVQGPGSTLYATNSDITIGSSGQFNRMEVLDGAVVTNTGIVRVGAAAAGSNNTLLVSGSATRLNVGTTLSLAGAANNQVTISNGALVSALSVTVNAAAGGNQIVITSGGILEGRGGNWSVSGTGNIVSNNGGVYQFTTVPGVVSAGGQISLTDGTLSFRNMTNASVFSSVSGVLANIGYAGNNAFRLNNSSNTAAVAQNYTFDTGRGATNFVGLELVNGSTLWRSATLAIGANGTLLASNTVGIVAASVTSTGAIHVVTSTLTFRSNVTIVGSYKSDPSTNFFNADVTVAQSGTLSGGAGDRFEFNKSLFIHSTNQTGFNLASSAVAFTGGGMHTNAITGQDLGNDGTLGFPDGFIAQNFSYGKLTLGSTNDQIQFTMGDGGLSNALYITSLDLGGFAGQFSSVSNMVTSLLFAPDDINIYYLYSGPGNGYLNNLTYQLAASPGGGPGGFLMPAIPEPSAVLLALAACAMLRRKRSRG